MDKVAVVINRKEQLRKLNTYIQPAGPGYQLLNPDTHTAYPMVVYVENLTYAGWYQERDADHKKVSLFDFISTTEIPTERPIAIKVSTVEQVEAIKNYSISNGLSKESRWTRTRSYLYYEPNATMTLDAMY